MVRYEKVDYEAGFKDFGNYKIQMLREKYFRGPLHFLLVISNGLFVQSLTFLLSNDESKMLITPITHSFCPRFSHSFV